MTILVRNGQSYKKPFGFSFGHQIFHALAISLYGSMHILVIIRISLNNTTVDKVDFYPFEPVSRNTCHPFLDVFLSNGMGRVSTPCIIIEDMLSIGLYDNIIRGILLAVVRDIVFTRKIILPPPQRERCTIASR